MKDYNISQLPPVCYQIEQQRWSGQNEMKPKEKQGLEETYREGRRERDGGRQRDTGREMETATESMSEKRVLRQFFPHKLILTQTLPAVFQVSQIRNQRDCGFDYTAKH